MVAQNDVHAVLVTANVYTDSVRQAALPTFISHPSSAASLQSEIPGMHQTIPHFPEIHDDTPCAAVHALPQVPQLTWSDRRSISQPFAVLPSQSPYPVSHEEAPAELPLPAAPAPAPAAPLMPPSPPAVALPPV